LYLLIYLSCITYYFISKVMYTVFRIYKPELPDAFLFRYRRRMLNVFQISLLYYFINKTLTVLFLPPLLEFLALNFFLYPKIFSTD